MMFPSQYEDKIIQQTLQHYQEMITEKLTLSSHCEEIAQLVLPAHSSTFMEGNFRMTGQKDTERQLDATAALALHRFMAICDSLLTPRNSQWHQLTTTNPYLNKQRAVRLWFENTTSRLFDLRYAPTSGFAANNQQVWRSLGAFGNGPLFVDDFLGTKGQRGLRYKAVPFGEIYFAENHQGIVDSFIRAFKMTARQIKQKWPDRTPEQVMNKLERTPNEKFLILHCVKPREEVDPQRADYKGMEYASYYICKDTKSFLSEGGYRSFPLPVARYDQEPGETYGRGPAMIVLPAIKTLQSEKKVLLKVGHRVADPTILIHDDGIAGDFKPGTKVFGGVSAEGKPLVQPMPIGNPGVTKEMMDDERAVVNDAFFVKLFQVLLEDPKVLTATQVVEMAKEKGILLTPTVGRQSDYLGLVIDRELDIAAYNKLIDPMPPEMIEARGEYTVKYTSPLAKAAQAQEAAGFMHSVETALEIANVMQSQEPLDPFDFDVAIPDMAYINGAPTRWMRSEQDIAKRRAGRAQQQQQQTAIQAAPGAAALIKAQAVAGKQGGAR